jgi:hypothetical protein
VLVFVCQLVALVEAQLELWAKASNPTIPDRPPAAEGLRPNSGPLVLTPRIVAADDLLSHQIAGMEVDLTIFIDHDKRGWVRAKQSDHVASPFLLKLFRTP